MNLRMLGLGFLCIGSLLSGCIATPIPKIGTLAPNSTLLGGHYDHFSPRWQVADQQQHKEDQLSIAIYGINISEYETMLIYSASGTAVDELTKSDTIVQIRDDQDRISELVSIKNAATIGNLHLGVMRFQPRQVGARELDLLVSKATNITDLVNMVVAWFVNPPEDPNRKGASYLVPTNQVFEQAGYRIDFLGWVPPQPSILPTPTVPGLSKGVTIFYNATLRIEEIEGDRVYQLHIRFLSNGEIICELNEYIKLPTQISP